MLGHRRVRKHQMVVIFLPSTAYNVLIEPLEDGNETFYCYHVNAMSMHEFM